MDDSSPIFKTFWVVLTCAVFLNGCRAIVGEEKRLMSALLKDYDTDEKPVINHSDTVNVELKVVYKQLQDVNEPQQEMTSLLWLKLRWKDAFLQWNPSDYGGCLKIRLHPSRIWKPDLTLYNNAHENGGDLYSFKTKISVSSDGTAVWLAPAILKSVCAIDVSKFPFDEQECILKIGSWSYDGLSLNLSLYENTNASDLSQYDESAEWSLLSATAVKNTVFYPCCLAPYEDITFIYRFRRKPLYYIMTIVFPCMVLSLLASTSFLFPADSGERVSLVISVLLGLVVFMLIVNDKTPVTSDTIPMITRYFSAIEFMTLLTLLATAFILQMNHASFSTPIPYYLAKVRDFLAVAFCMKKDVWSKPTQLDFGEVVLADAAQWLNLRDLAVPEPTRKRLTEEKILRELQKLSKRLEDDDFANERKDDWHYTMRVFDKLFFYIFLLVFLSLFAYVLTFV